MTPAERDADLEALEATEVQRLHSILQPHFGDQEVDEIIASLAAIVRRRVGASFSSTVEQLAEVLGTRVVELVHGPNKAFHVHAIRLGDWLRTSSGTAWLDPDNPLTIEFAAGPMLQFAFDLSVAENQVSLDPGPDVARLRFGYQTVSRLMPVEITAGEPDTEPAVRFLIQVFITPTPYTGQKQVLRLDYSLYWREEHPGTEEELGDA